MKSWLTRAREASGLEPEQCAHVLCRDLESYLVLEKQPGFMSVDELRALRASLSEEGLSIVRAALLELVDSEYSSRS